MGKPYKLLALDMDGTLLNEKSEVSEENRRWIDRAIEAGITVVFATGRGYPSALPFAEQLGLSSPMVLVNGGEVWASPDRLHSRTLLEPERVEALRELALRHEDTWYWAYSVERVYNKNEWVGDVREKEWLKFGFYTENTDALREITQAIPAIGDFEVTNSHPCNLELNPKGVSKASGLHAVCGMLGIGMNDIVACGDSLNDVAMLREAGLGVAMGNAQDAVKAEADVVTLTNEEDGVAHVIRTYMLV